MGKHRVSAVLFGVIMGFICFSICVFLVSPQLSLILGILTATLYTIVLSIIGDINFSKYKHDESYFEEEILLRDGANYYRDKLIINGTFTVGG